MIVESMDYKDKGLCLTRRQKGNKLSMNVDTRVPNSFHVHCMGSKQAFGIVPTSHAQCNVYILKLFL